MQTGELLQEIKEELKATKSVTGYFQTNLITKKPIKARARKRWALLYEYVGGRTEQDARNVKELKELAYCFKGSENSAKLVCTQLYNIIDKLGKFKLGRFVPLKEYAPYLERKARIRSNSALRSFFGSKPLKKPVLYLDQQIIDPRSFIKDPRFNKEVSWCMGPIHGDLHPSNVLWDGYKAGLIDFAWGNTNGHRIIDHVLMENSLRFMIFPKCTNLEQQLRIDRALLKLGGYREISQLAESSKLKHEYARLASLLEIIRKSANSFLTKKGEKGFIEYLVAQFMMLYRQIGYPDYQSVVTARALGMIANHLHQNWQP